MARKILVTGAAGHLGAGLMLHLPRIGEGVIGIDILSSSTTTEVGSIADLPFLRGIFEKYHPTHVLHTATLHKPHVESHSLTDFVSTNVQGTVNLLELSKEFGVQAFVFTSTTSTFGHALKPAVDGGSAVWIDETVVPVVKNIYGITKICAEDICGLFHKQHGLPIVVLRISRFFPELDDVASVRAAYPDDLNVKINELCYRRVDLHDVVTAHLRALDRAPELRWGKYIVSGPTPFDAPSVVEGLFPQYKDVYAARGWKYFASVDRVYDSSAAMRDLGWEPEFTFARALENVDAGKEWRSPLTLEVGIRGYHAVSTSIYTAR
ncbi:NAD-dependent epimerase/dehydratase [Auriculariales sp. MPI-PUGE-AT-0066]|nr:NAD-dependent epimerase/dehydratase [Auriculariales sp. MPI-PUGE-AT-0066]